MSTSVEYGRVGLVTDKGFCKDAAGNQFTRTKASWFFVYFGENNFFENKSSKKSKGTHNLLTGFSSLDRRDVYVDLRTRIPEQLLPLDNNVRLVQGTNKQKNLKLYLYFTQPIVNTSAEVLKSIRVSQGSLISATSNNDTLGNRRFGSVCRYSKCCYCHCAARFRISPNQTRHSGFPHRTGYFSFRYI